MVFKSIFKIICICLISWCANSYNASASDFLYNYLTQNYVPHALAVYDDWREWDLSNSKIFESLPLAYKDQFLYNGFYNDFLDSGVMFKVERPKLIESGMYCRSGISIHIYLSGALNGENISPSSIIILKNVHTIISFDRDNIKKNCNEERFVNFKKYILIGFEDEDMLLNIRKRIPALLESCKEITTNKKIWATLPSIYKITTKYRKDLGSSIYSLGLFSSNIFGEVWFSFENNSPNFIGCEYGLKV